MWGARRVDRLSIPKPCHTSWGEMPGDNAERFCPSCNKTVHDLSSLTRRQTADLLERSSDGLCARISRDHRGKIRFLRDPQPNSIARLVQLSLLGVSASAAQTNTDPCTVRVTVSDASGAAVPGVRVTLAPAEGSQASAAGTTDSSGLFSDQLSTGHYDLKVESLAFETYVKHDVQLACNTPVPVSLDVQLQISAFMGQIVDVERPNVLRRFWQRIFSRG
jgi:hypothetical protein